MSTRIQDLPEDDKPREKLETMGASALSGAELIAIFLRTGREGASAIDIARELIDEFGSLGGVARASVPQICKAIKGIGPAKAVQIKAAIELGTRVSKERYKEEPLDSPEAVYELLGAEMKILTKESLRVILLDARHHMIRVEELTKGSTNESIAHPRDILEPAIVHSATAFILVHNHPSGNASPSTADRQVTDRVAEVSEALRVDFLDHVIIGSESEEGKSAYFSFREAGLM